MVKWWYDGKNYGGYNLYKHYADKVFLLLGNNQRNHI